MLNAIELRQQRLKLIADARRLTEENEKRATPLDEDFTRADKMLDDADDLRVKAEREERLAAAEQETATLEGDVERPSPGGGNEPDEVRSIGGRMIARKTVEQVEGHFRSFLRGDTLTSTQWDQVRALEAGSDPAGGFTVPSQQMLGGFLKNVDDLVFIRGLSSVETMTQSESLGVLTLTDPADFNWTSELATGSADTTMSFGKRELRPHPLAKSIKVSRKLLRSSSRNPEDLVFQRFAYKRALTEEKAFMTGTGTMQPLGIFTASADGISTGRDVSTGNTSTAMTPDGLMEAKYTLKSAYWGDAQWVFHRDGIKQIAKLKDGEGRYMFDVPTNTLLTHKVNVSENAPNTFTASLYVGILGAFKLGYQIVDALDITIQRLDELYAVTNQVGFIMRSETDAAPVLEEAFVRVKLAA